MRGSIGVALQAAALDPYLNAWEHMDLQTALQGVPRSERKQRGKELLERVELTGAADRRVGGYSGGMKRRLDLALALVHRPRVLFLDEPTTGLDPQSRTALWEEVARLVKEEGMTVFLTTQYLEEADIMADRVGIIDHGEIVAEDTPAGLKEEIGRPTVEAIPVSDSDWAAISKVLERFGELSSAAHKGVAVRLAPGVDNLSEIVRALDAEGLKVANLELHAPTLDDVFLEKTGRSLAGAAEEPEPEAPGALEQLQVSVPGVTSPGRQRMTPSLGTQVVKLARRSIARTLRQPAVVVPNLLFPIILLAILSAGGDKATDIKGFPTDSYITFILGATLVQGAGDRDNDGRRRPRQ